MGIRKTDGNLLMESFHDRGRGMACAKAAFEEIEKATHVTKLDVSIAAFLSVWQQDNDKLQASYLGGDPLFEQGPFGFRPMPIRNVEVAIPKAFAGIVNTIMIDGGETKDNESLERDDFYIMSPNAFAGLSDYLKLGYSSTGMEHLVRDQTFATGCAQLNDELNLNVVYREKDGVKRAVCIYALDREWPTFDEILNEVDKIGESIGRTYKVGEFDITQKRRYVTFMDENNKALSVILSDTDLRKTKLTWGTKRIAVEGKEIAEAFSQFAA